ncbi:DUF6350 family protein [Subtercola vilae]|uniref:Uncharacterized protein n=1 Tax=Subtercola vilae TaxID=2056433 RepID=A0A4T2BQG6_9MICO|nr:DUF6350 family protein [Subtercola vilae]TIH33480.1 hypothetical protein D4765_14900 [Subtercola vilae]
MNRPTTALLAALDALLAVAIGIGIPLVMLTILWAVQFDLAIDWSVFWRSAVDFWMLGNGVDLRIALDPQTAAQLALDQAAVPFEIGIAPLGFALLTVFLGRRSGLRLGQSAHPVLGLAVGMLTVAALAALAWQSAQSDVATPSLRQAVLFVPFVYGLGLLLGIVPSVLRERTALFAWFARQVHRIPAPELPLVATALRGGAMIATGLVAVAGLAVALLLVIQYSTVVSLYESLQSGIAGGAGLTLAQLALMPNIVVWAASWMLGPGFVLGTGSAVTPLGTQLGLIPSLPVFGALPQGSPLGFAALIVPVAIAFLVAVVLRPRLRGGVGEDRAAGRAARPGFGPVSVGRVVATGVGMGLVAASILALLALWAGGAMGPGRLADVGPDPAMVWLWAAVEFSVACTVGLLASGVRFGASETKSAVKPTTADDPLGYRQK